MAGKAIGSGSMFFSDQKRVETFVFLISNGPKSNVGSSSHVREAHLGWRKTS